MFHISRRTFFTGLIGKLAFFAEISKSNIASAIALDSLDVQFCNTKGVTKNSSYAPWFTNLSSGTFSGKKLEVQSKNLSLQANTHEKKGLASNHVHEMLHWSRETLTLIQKYQQNPLRACRSLAYIAVAMHDAFIWSKEFVKVDHSHMNFVAQYAAHRAASLLLAHLYPSESEGRFESQFLYLSQGLSLSNSLQEFANDIGKSIALALIDRSWQDGASRAWNMRRRPQTFEGIWTPAYPLFAVNPTEGMAGEWRPWLLPNKNRYDPPVALRPNTDTFLHEMNQVIDVNRHLTSDETRIARFWNLEAGSVTPGGIWIQIGMNEILKVVRTSDSQQCVEHALVVMADLSVTIHDAFIACWKIKFRDWSERPITAIRRHLDPNFTPLLVTPSFPSYVSGHATISAAAAKVLSHHMSSKARDFEKLASEAAKSRLLGGIHFEGDNQQGLLLGASVGNDVVQHRLKNLNLH